jgi:hypothetical protein
MRKIIERPMGKIITTLVITNRTDEVIATRGGMNKDTVRVVELDNVWWVRVPQRFAYLRMSLSVLG